jgi:hypothetical protein
VTRTDGQRVGGTRGQFGDLEAGQRDGRRALAVELVADAQLCEAGVTLPRSECGGSGGSDKVPVGSPGEDRPTLYQIDHVSTSAEEKPRARLGETRRPHL